jgi:tetratricopeptide (TPR) repeat protein
MAQEKMYKAALEAIDQGQTARARDLFTRLLRSDSSKAEYWLWMSTLVDSHQERIYCLESALRVDPDNEAAKRGLIILGARQGGDDVIPIPPIHRNWEKEIEDVVEPPKSTLHRITNSTLLRLALGLVAVLIVSGLIYMVLSGKKSEPEPVVIYKVSPFPTRTEIPSTTPTVTRTMPVRTRTPTVIGPTPLWMFLIETYTPVPIYVDTPHPIIEAYRTGIRAFEKSDWAALLEFMDQAIALDSGSPDLYYYRAEAFRLLNRPKDAVIEYGKALDIDPKFAPAYLGLAYAYEAIKPNTNVEGELSYAIDYDPFFLDAYLARAMFRIKNGNPEGALEDLLAAESLRPEHPMIFILRSQAYLALGDPAFALDNALFGHELDITLLPAYLTLAKVYLTLQDNQQALDNIEIYLRYIQDDAEGWVVKAQVAYQMGNIDQALDACSKGTTVNSENALSWYYCGLIHLQYGDARTAVNELVAASNLDPLNFDYSIALAKALWADNRLDTAVLQYKNAEAIASNDFQLGMVYYYRAQMYEQALNLTKASLDWRLLLDLPADQVSEEWRILAQERWNIINDITPSVTTENTQVPSSTITPAHTPNIIKTPTPAETLPSIPSPTPSN